MQKTLIILAVLLITKSVTATGFPSNTQSVSMPHRKGIRSDLLKNIAPLIEHSIAKNYYPGAVVLAAHRGKIIYQGVFGSKRVMPDLAPMQFNTIFDLASLTKVVATTPAIMQLIEQGKLALDAPVKTYWPAFASNHKDKVTIRELLTHTSGLPAELPNDFQGADNAYKQIESLPLTYQPGSQVVYSDVNFIILAHLVEMISHEHFDQYAINHIFKPLGMKHTRFLPGKNIRQQIAPTEVINGVLRWGEVHDPIAHAMNGISGNAGLFSNAHDLAIYAQWLLDGKPIFHPTKLNSILGRLTILKMVSPQTPQHLLEVRALGWDIDSNISNRGNFFPLNSYGHTGYTGTSIWIDPFTQTWLIVLTSRTHPGVNKINQIAQDRRIIANIIAASLDDISPLANVNTTTRREIKRAYT